EEHELDRGEPSRDVSLRYGRQAARRDEIGRGPDGDTERDPPRPGPPRVEEDPRYQTQDAAGREPGDLLGRDVRLRREHDDREEDEPDATLGKEQPGRDQLDDRAARHLRRIRGEPGLPGSVQLRSGLHRSPLQCWITRWQIGW